ISSIEKWDASSSPVLLLEVDSPGGGAVASKELYDALRSVKKPVVAYLGEVAASGGYYAASATQYIVANPNTLTGSLGARAEILNYEQLFQKIGLRSESVQSGRLKDIGAGYRNMTPEERSILQGIIDELKGNFQKDVETARAGKLTPQFQTVLDSRVLSAKQALTAGLIDQVGTRKEALKMAAELGGLADDPAECRLDELNPFEKAFQSFGSGFARSLLSAAGPTSVRLSYS
ncbi:MAG TPA: signal peptide peptidase SppA, partial [Candidatus Norongarragalinales archaeon]|nr:signal peptide peptidase SppA [Candidatus Norongarragalinales archaeon]